MDPAKDAVFYRKEYGENCAALWLSLDATTVHHTFQAAVRQRILDTVLIYARGQKNSCP